MEEDQEDGLRPLASYGSQLLDTFGNILRESLDSGDMEYFKEAGDSFWRTIDVSIMSNRLGVGIDVTRDEPVVGGRNQTSRIRAEAVVSMLERREALWLALGAWVCHLIANSRLAPEASSQAIDRLMQPLTSFRRLWRAFSLALAAESDDRLPLSNWQIREMAPKQVHWMGTNGQLALYFVLAAIAKNESQLPELSALARMAEPKLAKRLVDEALEKVRDNREIWKSLLGEKDTAPIETQLADLMTAAEEEEREQDRRSIMAQPLSQIKIEEFLGDFLEEWASHNLLRSLFEEVDAIEYRNEPHPNKRILQIWQIFPKGAFVDDPRGTIWMRTGENFGRGAAEGENRRIYTVLRRYANKKRVSERLVPKRLLALLIKAKNEFPPPYAVLYRGDWRTLHSLGSLPEYVSSYRVEQNHDHRIEGLLDGVPIFFTAVEGKADEFIVCALRGSARLIQYMAHKGSIFRCAAVEGFSLQDAGHPARSDIDWLPKSLKQASDTEFIDYITENVSIRIMESLDVEVTNSEAIACLTVAKGQEGGLEEDAPPAKS